MKSLTNADRSKLAIGGLVFAVAIFIAVNVFANTLFKGVQMDLTQNHLYTLSDGTKKVLDQIDEPITVRLYFSKELGAKNPMHKAYYDRVRELLERYQQLSGGMIRLELYDPAPFSDEEDRAVAFGLQALPINQSGDKGYFGLAATNSTDDLQTIPYLSPERERFLEYDLTKTIYNLVHPEKKRIGIISGLPVMGGSMVPGMQQQLPEWAFVKQLKDFYDVVRVPIKDKYLPNDLDALMVIHPRGLNDDMRYAIDQFIMRGGKAFVAVDPVSEFGIRLHRGDPNSGSSNLPDLMKTWGIKMVPAKVVGDLDTARRVNVSRGGDVQPADYVLWMSLGPDNFNHSDAVTGDLQTINMATAGALEKVKGADTKIEPLIQVGPKAELIPDSKARINPNVAKLFQDFKPDGKHYMLAAHVTGNIKSAFPNGMPNPPKNAKTPEQGGYKTLKQSKQPANLIVVSDSDFLSEQFWAQSRNLAGQQFLVPYANNGDFVINAMENLLGGNVLSSLRGRSATNRPFTLVDKIRQNAERQYRAKEDSLKQKLRQVRGNLDNLMERRNAGSGSVLSDKERETIDQFRRQMISIRQELRGVQRSLRKNIDDLDTLLKFLNIAAIPLLLGMIAIVVAIVRRVRRPKAS